MNAVEADSIYFLYFECVLIKNLKEKNGKAYI
jgi:hypothetical protein